MKTIKPFNLITSVIPAEYKIRPQAEPIYEMADELKRYRRDVRNAGAELYHHLIHVFILGNKLSYLEHWKHEIKSFAEPVFSTTLKKATANINRGKLIRSEMMSHYMGADFEDYDMEQLEYALQCEINKTNSKLKKDAFKEHWSNIRREQKIVQETKDALTQEITGRCREPLEQFYKMFIETATARDYQAFCDAVDELQPIIE